MPKDDINDITADLAEIYGVDRDDVEATIDYVSSGTLEVTIPDDIPQADAISVIQESISDVLGVHSSDVVVSFDDDGVLTYSVIGATFAEASGIQDIASQDN